MEHELHARTMFDRNRYFIAGRNDNLIDKNNNDDNVTGHRYRHKYSVLSLLQQYRHQKRPSIEEM